MVEINYFSHIVFPVFFLRMCCLTLHLRPSASSCVTDQYRTRPDHVNTRSLLCCSPFSGRNLTAIRGKKHFSGACDRFPACSPRWRLRPRVGVAAFGMKPPKVLNLWWWEKRLQKCFWESLEEISLCTGTNAVAPSALWIGSGRPLGPEGHTGIQFHVWWGAFWQASLQMGFILPVLKARGFK